MTIEQWIVKNLNGLEHKLREDIVLFLKTHYSHKRSINFNLEQCLEKMKELSKQENLPKFDGKVSLIFKSKNFSIFKLEDKIAIKHEGLLQDNCLSDLTSPFVHVDGSIDYFTIRDHNLNPIATLSIINKELLELKGYQNRPVKYRYLREILEAIDELGFKIEKHEDIGLIDTELIRRFDLFENAFDKIKKIDFKNKSYVYSKNFIEYIGNYTIEDKIIFLSTMVCYDFNRESIIQMLEFCKETTSYEKIEGLVEKIKFKNTTLSRIIADFLITNHMNSIVSAMNFVFLAERESNLLLKIWKKYEDQPIVRELIASRFSQNTKGWIIYKELTEHINFTKVENQIILSNLMKSLSNRDAKKETILELVKKLENEENFQNTLQILATNAVIKNVSNCYHLNAPLVVENVEWFVREFGMDLEAIKSPILYSARFDKNLYLLNFLLENLSLSKEDCLIIKNSIKNQSDSFGMLLKSLKALNRYEKKFLSES